MRYFLTVLIILMFATVAFAEPMVSVSKGYLERVKNRLEKLQAIEVAIPTVSIKGIEVIQDAQNRVFIKDSASVEIKLAMLEYADSVTIKGKVKQYFVPKSEPFVSRFGLMTGYDFDLKEKTTFKNALYLSYDVLRIKKFAIAAAVNSEKFSFGISRRITPNTKLYFGVAKPYHVLPGQTAAGLLALGFNF